MEDVIDVQLMQILPVFLRISGFVLASPGFGHNALPSRLKIGFAFVMAIFIGPTTQTNQVIDLTRVENTIVIVAEVAIGVLLGLLFRFLVIGLSIAATITAQSISLSQMLGSPHAENLPALGILYQWGGLALLIAIEFHIKFAEILILSYDVFPIGEFTSIPALIDIAINYANFVFKMAFALAAPFVALSLIYNVILGLINRAMPQLMVFFVGAPALIIFGLLLLVIAMPVILDAFGIQAADLMDLNFSFD